MSRDASIEFEWADGTYQFRLALGQLQKLQVLCDAGPAWIYARLESGTMWKVEDVLETIRWGLIGGGKTADEARKLVKLYVEGNYLDNITTAQKIIYAAIGPPEDEPLKKAEGATTATESGRSQTESSASPLSTETVS